MGVAPHRFTESEVSDAPKPVLDSGAGSGPAPDPAGPVVTGSAETDPAETDPAETDPAAGAEPGEAGERAPQARRGRRAIRRSVGRRPMLVLSVAFAVLVVALAAIAIKLGLGLQAQQRQQDNQQAALHAARQAAADLMTVSYKSAGNDINRILGVATGSFYSQVSADRKQLVSETESAHAVSTANVLSAGIVGGQITGNTATVIVVVDSTITSKNAPNGVVNHYRETITLHHTGRGWLASQVNFATPSGQ